MSRRSRPRLACPACGREVSYSYVDPMVGPIVWRRHVSAITGSWCVDDDGRDQRRPVSYLEEGA